MSVYATAEGDLDRQRERIFPMDGAKKAMFTKSMDSVKGLVEACKGIDESLKG